MELVGIELERPPNIPCLVLREAEGAGRVLPIFIGGPEATAIAFALEEVETPRPMTHDLMKDLLDEVGAIIERIVVTELRDATFYAEIILTVAGQVHSVSARPSDAVALAVRMGAEIDIDADLLDRLEAEGTTVDWTEDVEEEDETPEELVDEFREFLEGLNPEDFS